MTPLRFTTDRRGFMTTLALGAAGITLRDAIARELIRTPRQTEGPFFPDRLPRDTDNDLLIINGDATPASGELTHLSGRILDQSGAPIRNAVVEIWQVDGNGVYLHSGTANPQRRDAGFQGFGRVTTGMTGEYYFRTVKPVAYPDRAAPHIHFRISRGGRELLTTQCYVKGHPGNDKDGIYRGIRDDRARESVTVEFAPAGDSARNELSARFDIVLGATAGA